MFMKWFIPQSVRLAKAREFETLKQGSMTIEEYDTEFNMLSKYVTHMLPDEREKIRRFVMGLCHSLRQFVKLHMETCPSYAAMVDLAKLTEIK